jgi:hypothetical protein
LLRFVCEPCQTDHLEPEDRKRLTDREAITRIIDLCDCTNVLEIGVWPAKKQEKALQKILEAGISIRQLSRITGISKAVIERISRKGT